MKTKQYKVIAGKVTVETKMDGGRAEVDFARDAILPADVPQHQIDHELMLGTIMEVERSAAPAPSDEDDGDGGDTLPPGVPVDAPALPEGMSVPTTLEWVGTDAERAEVALSAETHEAGQNRSTLVKRLQEIIASAEEAAANADPGAGPSVDS
jgi:hypothetical protein